jgi:hypothetical protein
MLGVSISSLFKMRAHRATMMLASSAAMPASSAAMLATSNIRTPESFIIVIGAKSVVGLFLQNAELAKYPA